MAAPKGNLLCFVLFSLFVNCISQSDIDKNTDISKCSCDLTANGCDTNCCCDVECDSDDRDAFSQCDDDYTPTDGRMCVQEEVMWRDNTKYTTEKTSSGLFCVDKDNYEERNYYEAPEEVDSQSRFDEYRDQYGGYNFHATPQSFPYSTRDYKSGDPVMTVYESGAVSYLGQPSPMTSATCKDNNPVAFLYSREYECVRPVVSLEDECSTNLALSADTYYEGFKVLSSPQAFVEYPPDSGTGSTTAAPDSTTENLLTTGAPELSPLYNSSYAVPITPSNSHLCIDGAGLNSSCSFSDLPAPVWDPATRSCNYTVIKVLYTLYWDGGLGVNRTLVTFAFKDLLSSALPLSQAFQTHFLKAGEEDALPLSGNPGYQLGLPVIAGDLSQNQDSSGTDRLAVDVSRDVSNRVSLVTSAPDGQCATDTDNRVPVTFRTNMRSGCFLRVFYSNMTDFCSLLQEQAVTALLGRDPPSHVATWGDSQVTSTGDWVAVLQDDLPAVSAEGVDSCVNVATGMHWEIMYANAGALGNPQAKIIGAAYRFSTQKVRFQCHGAFCQPGSEGVPQMVEVVSSVAFIDASKRAVGESAARPQLDARLPEDFFYPFS